MAACKSFSVTPWSFNNCDTFPEDLNIARIRCSIDTNSSFIFCAIDCALVIILPACRDKPNCPPSTFGNPSIIASNACVKIGMLIPTFFKINGVTFSSTSKTALKICSFSICCCPKPCTITSACCKASCDFMEKLFKVIVLFLDDAHLKTKAIPFIKNCHFVLFLLFNLRNNDILTLKYILYTCCAFRKRKISTNVPSSEISVTKWKKFCIEKSFYLDLDTKSFRFLLQLTNFCPNAQQVFYMLI